MNRIFKASLQIQFFNRQSENRRPTRYSVSVMHDWSTTVW